MPEAQSTLASTLCMSTALNSSSVFTSVNSVSASAVAARTTPASKQPPHHGPRSPRVGNRLSIRDCRGLAALLQAAQMTSMLSLLSTGSQANETQLESRTTPKRPLPP